MWHLVRSGSIHSRCHSSRPNWVPGEQVDVTADGDAEMWLLLITCGVLTTGVAGLLLTDASLFSAWRGLPLDDAWIHATIARNVAMGHGWSFNPDVATGGSTARSSW